MKNIKNILLIGILLIPLFSKSQVRLGKETWMVSLLGVNENDVFGSPFKEKIQVEFVSDGTAVLLKNEFDTIILVYPPVVGTQDVKIFEDLGIKILNASKKKVKFSRKEKKWIKKVFYPYYKRRINYLKSIANYLSALSALNTERIAVLKAIDAYHMYVYGFVPGGTIFASKVEIRYFDKILYIQETLLKSIHKKSEQRINKHSLF